MNPQLEKIGEALSRLSTRQKIQMGAAIVAVMGLLWGFTVYVNRIRYGVLFSGLDRDDAAPVISVLKERQVPFRLAAGGAIVEVPFERVDELRLELAGEGLPSGGGAGYELFDKPAFGLSDFVQNVNYRRALERELARTIKSLDAVQSARVHLALPPEPVFADERRQPSASVVVRLHSGRLLAADRVRAITHMVASGVEGLEPESVSVIDGEGRMLSGGSEEDRQMLSASQLEIKRGVEKSIESTLVSILEPLIGPGKVRARATVELNMTRVERVEESYDSAGAVVRSEQKSKTRNEGGGGPGGIPGTAANLPGGTALGAAATGERQETQSTTTNFEIPKTISTISEPAGMLARQSVAVVVDHALVETAGESGATEQTPTPRSPGEMQKITELVQAAIGFDELRGDQLIVQNIAFDETAVPAEEPGSGAVLDVVLKVLRYGSLPLAVLLLSVLVIRPAISAMRGLKDQTRNAAGEMPPTVAQLQAQLSKGSLAGAGETGSPLRAKLIEAVSEDPRAAALVIRNWIDRRGDKG